MFLGVELLVGGKKVDERAKRAIGRENGTAGIALLSLGMLGSKAIGVIATDDFLYVIHILLVVANVERTVNDRIVERFGDLRLASARHSRRLVAVESLSSSTDETEGGSLGVLQKTNLVTRRVKVDMTRQDAD